MLKIFRKTRQDLLMNKKIGNYLLYAIGEIVLVMIGILLALQVNNWSEARKNDKELKNILSTIANDLAIDTVSAAAIVQLYDTIESNSRLIIAKKINRTNQAKFPMVRSLATVYSPFSNQTKGFEQLKKFTNKNEVKNDTLVTSISRFYVAFNDIIEDNNTFIKKEVLENIDAFKEKPWFVDWTQNKFTEPMKVYFLDSEEYRKRIAANLIFAVGNHKSVVASYKRNAKELIKRIGQQQTANK